MVLFFWEYCVCVCGIVIEGKHTIYSEPAAE